MLLGLVPGHIDLALFVLTDRFTECENANSHALQCRHLQDVATVIIIVTPEREQ
jgi:hypothetical protein